MHETSGMSDNTEKETTGAWIVHHGRKVAQDVHGASEFPAIDESAKTADLLSRLATNEQEVLSHEEVNALARSARLNPRTELQHLLTLLEGKRLIERNDNGIEVIGITTRGALSHSANIFREAEPTKEEVAAITLAEMTSERPVSRREASEFIGDTHTMTNADATSFLDRSHQIGFVDAEGKDDDCLLFNGNLFRKDNIMKTSVVLNSLSSQDQTKVTEFDNLLKAEGCINVQRAETILGAALFDKIKAAGIYDLNTVSNDNGENVYITSPGAFHKYVNPLVDDCFDMAKALVAALTYGIQERSSSQGRIVSVQALLNKLISGQSVGPASAIGQDYRVLELNRVVKTTRIGQGSRFTMRLLKKDIGELALQVLTTGNANDTSITLPNAPMNLYIGPEESRFSTRKKQSELSKKGTYDILSALRGGRSL